jgi:putative hydrolase of the HAD superfamily
MNIRAVFWDLGGVLVRTEDHTTRENLAIRLGMSRTELENLVFAGDSGNRAQLGEINAKQHWQNLGSNLGLSIEEMVVFQRDFWGGDQLDTALIESIRALRTRHKIGLISNAFSDLRQIITNVWNIEDAFDDMTISSETGIMKPDPRIFQIALERLDVQPQESIFIDDFPHNVDGARNINMRAIHFQTRDQTLSELENLLNESQLR